MLNTPQEIPDNINELTLGELIVIARNRANLSQATLGKRTEISRVTICRYENGYSRPSCDRLRQIAKAVNHPVEWFYR